ncbi:MAG: branched-chain amino acid ABC transporter permease [Frankia sp.]|nr:branched-chain amino acid ABC transporter permease [Frankia sp.]
MLTRANLIRAAVAAAIVLFCVFGLAELLSLYYIGAMTQVALYSVVALGLGVLVGRVGLYSLGQAAILAIGAWVAARLLFATSQPHWLVLLEAGVITMVIGILVGLPALRLRGLYLALITLMLAGAISVLVNRTNFPNGGGGFLGYDGRGNLTPIPRPDIADSDRAFFRYTVIVAAVMFVLVLVHLRTKPGRAWAAIRQSEPAALAAGINITLYKLWALALASFVTGVAGGLLASGQRFLFAINFPPQESITLLAVVLMGGAYSLWGAIVAGVLLKLLPALLNDWGLSADWLFILFGIGVLQVLTTAPRGLADQFPKDMANLGRLLWRIGRGLTGRARQQRQAPPAAQAGAAGTGGVAAEEVEVAR